MKTINKYKFKNKKILRTSYLSNKDRKDTVIPKCDCILFEYSKDGKNFYDGGLYLRPDEALIIAKMLIDAVYKVTGTYTENLLGGYYGYKEEKL